MQLLTSQQAIALCLSPHSARDVGGSEIREQDASGAKGNYFLANKTASVIVRAEKLPDPAHPPDPSGPKIATLTYRANDVDD